MKKALITIAVAALAFQIFTWKNKNSQEAPKLGSPVHEVIVNDLIDKDKKNTTIPKQDFYLIYFSAHWCPPCRTFTPILAKFHKINKKSNNFEVIFVSNDRSDAEMYKYMKQMPWPAVKKFSDAYGKLSKTFGAKGIPNLVLVDKHGTAIATSYIDGEYVGPTVVLDKFKQVLNARPMAKKMIEMAQDITDQRFKDVDEITESMKGIEIPQISIPTKTAEKTVNKIEGKAEPLTKAVEEIEEKADTKQKQMTGVISKPMAKAEPGKYKLSGVVSSGSKKWAIINGKMHTQGDTIDLETTIKEIKQNGVILIRNQQELFLEISY